jgi:hypothetical protein
LGTRDSLCSSISEITGIDDIVLHGVGIQLFCVAQRISWASRRQTTRIEDEAYCLLGILEIIMPLLYGEGKRAFRRLQEEIIRTTNDHSIFAWTGKASYNETANDRYLHNFLADSLLDFKDCADIARFTAYDRAQNAYFMTNEGLRINLPTTKGTLTGHLIALLDCGRHSATDPNFTRIGILIEPLRSGDVDLPVNEQWGMYGRASPSLEFWSCDRRFSWGNAETVALTFPERPFRFVLNGVLRSRN